MILAPSRQILAALAGIVALAIGAALIAGGVSASAERMVTVAMLAMIAVAGMGIYCGNSGIISFGHLSFMAIGAYVSALLTLPVRVKVGTLPNLPGWLQQIELGLWPAILVAMLVAMVFAAVVGLAIGRLDGSAATIATLGLLVIVHGIIIGWRDVTRGAQSFFGVPRETGIWQAVIGLIAVLVLARLYRDSASGLRLRAARENAIAARSVGIHIRRERMIAWVLSAAAMALAGALLAHFLGAFSVKKFYFTDTFFLLAMMIVGGASTVTGAIAGTALITLVTEILRRFESGFDLFGMQVPAIFGTTQIGIALIILITMFRKPEGLFGLREWEERLFPAAAAAGKAPPVEAVTVSPEILRAEGVTMRFGGLVAVNDVTLVVRPGEVLGLIGPNGSGKSTLLNMLSGVLVPTGGRVLRGDADLTGLAPEQFVRHGIARTFQNIRLFSHLSVRQNVLVAALGAGRDTAEARTAAAIARMGLQDVAEAESGTLSYGDQRRAEIARALACRPDFLFLDEPAAGMNREETDRLMEILRDVTRTEGIGIILVDHDLKLISDLCSRVVVINEGHMIADGDAAEVKRNPAVIEAYLGHKHAETAA